MEGSRIEVEFEKRFQGPWPMVHGGYICGFMATHLEGSTAEVTLNAPTPTGKLLILDNNSPDRVLLYEKDKLLVEAQPAELELKPPITISIEEAKQSSLRHLNEWPLPNCFGCGTARADDDGLHLRAGPVENRDAVATDWIPQVVVTRTNVGENVPEPILWAAIECTVIQALECSDLMKAEESVILGRMTASIRAWPRVGQLCFTMGWAAGRDGRKITVEGTMHDESGGVLVIARLIFITIPQTAMSST